MKTSRQKIVSLLLVVIAATLWGMISLGSRNLTALGFTQTMIVFARSAVAFLSLALVLLFADRSAFRIKLRDIWCFLGTGIASLALFNFCYFMAMTYLDNSVAVVLLYLAPAFVVLMSAPLFGERITAVKLIAVALVIVGAACTAGAFSSSISLPLVGILFGIGSGVGYALYSIFSRFALNRGYTSKTISLYTFFFSALGTAVVAGLTGDVNLEAVAFSPDIIGWTLFLGIVCCTLPYLSYTAGLKGLENGRASVAASLEVVVATITGVVAFNEGFALSNLVGIVLVIGGIAVMNSDALSRKTKPKE